MKALRFFTIIFLSLLSKNVFGQKTSQISLSNSLGIARADELIVLPRKLLEKKFGAFPIDQYVIVTTKDKAPIVVQYDDMTGDGIWDALAFLYSFKPKENVFLSQIERALVDLSLRDPYAVFCWRFQLGLFRSEKECRSRWSPYH